LNCPGDPGCPGYVAPGSTDYTTSLLQEILANQQASGVTAMVPATGATVCPDGTAVPASGVCGQTFTQWLNANSTAALIGAGVIVFLLMGMRR